MVDYIRHIMNVGKAEGFDEELVEAAVNKFEQEKDAGTISFLQDEKKLDTIEARELVSIIKRELKKIKRESFIRGLIYIFVFITIGALAWQAQGYWLGYIFFGLAAIKVVTTFRVIFNK